MHLTKCAAAIATSLVLAVGSSSAETIRFQFSGKVTYGAPMAVLPGTEIIGTFSYDTNTEPAYKQRVVVGYQIPAPHMITARVGGHTITASNLDVTIFNHSRGNVEDMISISAGPMVLDGTTFSNGTFGISLGSSPNNNRALTNNKLPSKLNVDLFDAVGFNGGTLQTDGGQTGTLLQFSVDSIAVVSVTP